MIYFILIYYAIALIYCGASYAVLSKINKNMTTSLFVLGIFAPVLCWVFFGIRLALTKGK